MAFFTFSERLDQFALGTVTLRGQQRRQQSRKGNLEPRQKFFSHTPLFFKLGEISNGRNAGQPGP